LTPKPQALVSSDIWPSAPTMLFTGDLLLQHAVRRVQAGTTETSLLTRQATDGSSDMPTSVASCT